MDCYNVKELLKFLGESSVPMDAKLQVSGGEPITRITYVPDTNMLYFDEECEAVHQIMERVDPETQIRSLKLLLKRSEANAEKAFLLQIEYEHRAQMLQAENTRLRLEKHDLEEDIDQMRQNKEYEHRLLAMETECARLKLKNRFLEKKLENLTKSREEHTP